MREHLSFALVLVAASVALDGQTTTRRERYVAITDRILFNETQDETKFTFPPRDEMDKLTGQLRGLAMEAIRDALSAPEPSAATVRSALEELQGRTALSKAFSGFSNVPFAELRSLRGARIMVVAFGLLRGGSAIPEIVPYVQFYSDSAGVWKLAAETGTGLAERMISVAKIESPFADSELWYVAWGRRIFDTGYRVQLELYAFDGLNVRTLWTREARRGEVTLKDGRIQVKSEEWQGWHAPARITVETLRPGSKGLERESITEKEQ